MQDITNYIKPELLVLIPVLYFVGIGIKKSAMSDKYIPLVLGGIGIALAALWVLATSAVVCGRDIALAVFTAITQGVLAAGASVYVNQVAKQMKKED